MHVQYTEYSTYNRYYCNLIHVLAMVLAMYSRYVQLCTAVSGPAPCRRGGAEVAVPDAGSVHNAVWNLMPCI